MTLQPYDINTVWHYHVMTLPWFENTTVWYYRIWHYHGMTLQRYDITSYDITTVWHYHGMTLQLYGTTTVWHYYGMDLPWCDIAARYDIVLIWLLPCWGITRVLYHHMVINKHGMVWFTLIWLLTAEEKIDNEH